MPFRRRLTAFAAFRSKLNSPNLPHRLNPRTRIHLAETFGGVAMDDDRLTEKLAANVFGWKLAPDRFIKSGRSWIPRWRFSPLERLEDAFGLLERVATSYRL